MLTELLKLSKLLLEQDSPFPVPTAAQIKSEQRP